jgi:hypothetical protein
MAGRQIGARIRLGNAEVLGRQDRAQLPGQADLRDLGASNCSSSPTRWPISGRKSFNRRRRCSAKLIRRARQSG